LSFDVNGIEPDITGKQCLGFYLIQQQKSGVITDSVDVAYLKFEDHWSTLHFEGETIFWKKSEMPLEPVNNCLSTRLILLNLNEVDGIVGCVLNKITYSSNEKTIFVDFEFTDGKTLKFKHYGDNDHTSIEY